ncbi:MAG: hypothetical protein WKF70_12780 [Chitinophagaceae bacterium]
MAEIKIEKKKTVWPWLLLALGIIALLVFLFWFRGRDENVPVAETSAPTELIDVHENNATVAGYVNAILADTATMSLDHTYAHEALTNLINATKAMAGEIGFDIKGDLDKAKEYADAITVDPTATTHAGNIKKAADIISRVLQNIQQAKYASLAPEAGEVSAAVMAISPETLTLNQRDAVKTFFGKAANLLQKMN